MHFFKNNENVLCGLLNKIQSIIESNNIQITETKVSSLDLKGFLNGIHELIEFIQEIRNTGNKMFGRVTDYEFQQLTTLTYDLLDQKAKRMQHDIILLIGDPSISKSAELKKLFMSVSARLSSLLIEVRDHITVIINKQLMSTFLYRYS